MGIEQIRQLKAEAAKVPIKRTLINRVSKKRAGEELVYQKKRKVFLEKHPVCEWPDKCKKKSVDIHHKAGRIGALLTDENNMIALCREHHVVAELNPKMAKEKLVSKSRLNK